MNAESRRIKSIKEASPAGKAGLQVGDVVIRVNNTEITDIFDYLYETSDESYEITVLRDGTEHSFQVTLGDEADSGIEFENGLMDDYRHCCNKCIFCFIDQMPKGMRETLYFKDDDSRLSFLQGNYVTLTNMSEHDIDRIIRYHMEPINISVQTMNRELRCEMLRNRFAGDALSKLDRLNEGGITMNGQIVLCKGINDGDELDYSISELYKYFPNMQSVSVVPVGLTKFRDGLYPLEPFTKEDAIKTLEIIENWQKQIYAETGMHFIHASDEFYILAERELPPEENYDDYLQLENGVGMLRLFINEFRAALAKKKSKLFMKRLFGPEKTISIATGHLAYPYIKKAADEVMKVCPRLKILVYDIRNDFFGEHITVSGLITGGDLMNQLKDCELGERLLLPCNMLRSGEAVFLDDVTLSDLETALQVKIDIVKSSGRDFLECIVK